MKDMLKFSCVVTILTFATISYAQQGQQGRGRFNMEPKEMAERQTSQMKELLSLTEEQLPKVEALNLKYAEKMKVARDETADDRDAMRSKMREMIGEKDVELKKILTADQWTNFEADRKERMQNRRGGSRRRGI